MILIEHIIPNGSLMVTYQWYKPKNPLKQIQTKLANVNICRGHKLIHPKKTSPQVYCRAKSSLKTKPVDVVRRNFGP